MLTEMKKTAILLLFLAVKTFAIPTQMLWLPETTALKKNNWRLDVRNQLTTDKHEDDVAGVYLKSSTGAELGVYERGSMRMETGIEWVEPAKTGPDAVYANIKVSQYDLFTEGLNVALGAHTIGFKTGTNDYNIVYLAVENRVGSKVRVSAGGYSGSSKLLLDESGKADNLGFFFGVWQEAQGGKGAYTLQYMSGRNHLGYLFAGSHFMIKEQVACSLGWGFANNRNNNRDILLFQLSVDM